MLHGTVTLQGKQVQAPAIVAHKWLAAMDFQQAWDLPEHQLEWITAVTLASFFGGELAMCTVCLYSLFSRALLSVGSPLYSLGLVCSRILPSIM